MAAVKITEKLTNEIRCNIAKPFVARYRATALMSCEDSLLLYKTHLVNDEQMEAIRKLPSRWISISTTDNLSHKLYIGHRGPNSYVRHWLQFDLPKNTPLAYSYSWTYEPNFSDGVSIENVNSSWMDIDLTQVGLSKDYIQELKNICAERDAALSTVDKLLGGCKTLNQAEKIWPAIVKYVDDDTRKRLHHKPERKTRESIGIDTDELQSLSVHHIRQQMTS
jgi:hypothetical protein